MSPNAFRSLMTGAVALLLSAGAAAQSIHNPSFSDAIASTDWHVYSGAGSVGFGGGVAELVGGTASDSAGMMYQELTGLTAGKTYQISFVAAGSGFLDVADDMTLTAGLALSNGSVGAGETDPAFAGWSSWMTPVNVFRVDTPVATPSTLQPYSMQFTASDDTEILWVKGFAGASTALRVDDFQLTPLDTVPQIPEPASAALLLAGLVALGGLQRLRSGR